MRDRNSYFKEYGILLTEITKRLQGDNKVKKQLHTAFKKWRGIKTLTKLKNDEIRDHVKGIRLFFTEHYGWVLREYGEKDIDPENMEMNEFLNKKLK